MAVLGPQRKFQCKLQAGKEQTNRSKSLPTRGTNMLHQHQVEISWSKSALYSTKYKVTGIKTPNNQATIHNPCHCLPQKQTTSQLALLQTFREPRNGDLGTFCGRHPHGGGSLQQSTKGRSGSMPVGMNCQCDGWKHLSTLGEVHMNCTCMDIELY